MAHVNSKGISQMILRGVVGGVNIQNSNDEFCNACVAGKAHRTFIPKVRTSKRCEGLPDMVHSDVCGPMEVPSIGGSRYFVTFIDDHSNCVVVFPIRLKSEAVECYLKFEKFSERQTGRKIRVLRSDRGGEYLSSSLTNHFEEKGIQHELNLQQPIRHIRMEFLKE